MTILSSEIVKFSNGDTDFYEAALENFSNPTTEKSKILNEAFFAEIEKKSGVKREGLDLAAWINHPSVRWVTK